MITYNIKPDSNNKFIASFAHQSIGKGDSFYWSKGYDNEDHARENLDLIIYAYIQKLILKFLSHRVMALYKVQQYKPEKLALAKELYQQLYAQSLQLTGKWFINNKNLLYSILPSKKKPAARQYWETVLNEISQLFK